ncbi:hypothetical protein PoB_001642000 [Plakobranchus ocellatus]|uniref:Uncharacterized protein n=1 Tax=Plakobranchus ocellatus TaxID=259542 RepID=A0AAV3Z3C1_9GAST|nr:hypothetical protein PoB_001642000 [Plakobranchus ocellatus]
MSSCDLATASSKLHCGLRLLRLVRRSLDGSNPQLISKFFESSRAAWSLFSTFWLVDPTLFSELNTRAWSPVCCMARWRNTCIIFAAVSWETLSCCQNDTIQGHSSPWYRSIPGI